MVMFKKIHLIFIFNLLFAQFPDMDDAFSELEGKLSMYFLNALNAKPIKGASVDLKGIGNFTSDANGRIQFTVPNNPFGKIPVTVNKSGYIKTDFILELK